MSRGRTAVVTMSGWIRDFYAFNLFIRETVSRVELSLGAPQLSQLLKTVKRVRRFGCIRPFEDHCIQKCTLFLLHDNGGFFRLSKTSHSAVNAHL